MSIELPTRAASTRPVHTTELAGYVGSLREDVGRALRSYLALPETVPLVWRATHEPATTLHVELGNAPASSLEIGGIVTGAAGTARVRLSPPRLDAPRESRLLFRLLRRRLSDPTANVSELVAAVLAWAPFRELRDDDYRKVSASARGFYGTLRVGYKCNQDCGFCWQDRKWPAPPAERFFGWLDEMAANGVESLNLTGGEPTTFPLVIELIRRAHQVHGMVVSLQTNAILFARPDALARFRDAGASVAMVSYHSADPAISDAMTRAPGTHERTARGIEAALGAGMTVMLNCVVESTNVEGLPALARDVVERFVTPFPANPVQRVAFAHPTSYRETGAWEARQVPFDVVRAPLIEACRTLASAGVPAQVVGTCGFPLCVLRDQPEISATQELERAVFDEHELEHRRYHPTCAPCTRRSACFGMRQEYLDHFGDRGLVPFLDGSAAGVGARPPRASRSEVDSESR